MGDLNSILRSVWRDRRGRDWSRRWTRTAGTATYEQDTLLIQIRGDDNQVGDLVASSDPDDVTGPVLLIRTVGTDLEVPGGPLVLAWQIPAVDTQTVLEGKDYMIEAYCRVNGELTNLFRHKWTVDPQSAVYRNPS